MIDLKTKFLEIFSGVEFETSQYNVLGQDKKFFVQEFTNLERRGLTPKITEFRKYFYEKLLEYIKSINHRVEKEFISEETIKSIKYYLFRYGSDRAPPSDSEAPLLAIPEYYYGRGVWTPHVSLLQLDSNRIPSKREQDLKISMTPYKKLRFVYDESNVEDVTLR